MGFSFDMLSELNIRMAAESTTREALIRELKHATETDIEPGVITSNSSLTIFSQELAVFLGQNNLTMIADLCDWFDCRSKWTYRTKHQGTDEIIGVWVNLLGATTPSILQNALPQNAIGGGLTSRIVFIYAPGREKRVALPFTTDEEIKTRELLLSDLEAIGMLKGPFRVGKPFLVEWAKWYNNLQTPEHLDSNYFDGYMQRKPTHVIKLCMILCASRTDSMIIEPDDLQRAVDFIEEAECGMPRVYSGFGRMPVSDIIPQIMSMLITKKVISKKQLMRKFLTELTLVQLDEILSSLQAAGYCKLVVTTNGIDIEFTGDKQ
jgi:hypothetical protein